MGEQAIFLLSIVVAIAVFDVVIIKLKGKRSSISAWTIRTSYKYPSIVMVSMLGLGIVLGHVLWRMKTLDIYECDSPEVLEIINTCEEK